jgi:hypothetical protein
LQRRDIAGRAAGSTFGGGMERMRTLAAEVCATWTSTLLLARQSVLRVTAGMPFEAEISVSFTR